MQCQVNAVTRADLQLELGQVTEVVTVEGAAATLQTEKGGHLLRDQLDGDHADPAARLPQLPELDQPGARRDAGGLPELDPGHAGSLADDKRQRHQPQQQRDAHRRRGLDQRLAAAPCRLRAPAETIETVNITTGSGDAEQGLSGGASTTVVTKSGTNELHGSAFWFHDNQHLRARNFFSPTKPVSNYNNFGGTVGGPIKKNKLFYFFSYDKTTQRVARRSHRRHGSDRGSARGRLQRLLEHDLRPGDGQPGRHRPDAVREQHDSDGAAGSDRAEGAELLSAAQRARHPDNFHSAGAPPFARQYIDVKVNYNHSDKYSIWGKYGNMLAPVSGHAIFGEPAVRRRAAPGQRRYQGQHGRRSATPTRSRRPCSMTACSGSGAGSERSYRRTSEGLRPGHSRHRRT